MTDDPGEIASLAGGLAHEIKNPLGTMALTLDLMAEDLDAAESPRDRRLLQKVETLRRECRRLEQVLEDFLRFARAQEIRRAPADLNAVVEEMLDFYRPKAEQQAIVIRDSLAPGLPPCPLDVDVFKQALLNLMLNAQHAMPGGGELMFRTRRAGDQVELDVTDTGRGMDSETQRQIFRAFFSTRPGGSGLGLPTTLRIIRAHGGTIAVHSEPGKGTCFTIRLPIAATA